MSRTLLIVDDIKTNRQILKHILGDEYDVLEAAHGEEALAVMQREYKSISAVLLDLKMPVMDGFEVLSYMQKSETLSQLPVIVTTGQTDEDSEERALKLGAKDYISKPYKSAIIKQRIKNTINLRETAATVNALSRDRLTGLYSREKFFEIVSELTSSHEAGYYTMACFDINRFKVINDQYGTTRGDEVLMHIAAVFRKGFEEIGGVCCRISADDFAVLYPSSFQDSVQNAEMRREAANVEGIITPIVFSIGRYVVNDLSLAPSAMYDRAMLAADAVKGRFDTQIGLYDESMRMNLLHEQRIVTEMEQALNTRQFEVWYQPQYNHSTHALIGAEALVRWAHPERGLVPPNVFVPVFEQNGFIYELDKFVWEEVCRFLRRELDLGFSPLPISVNISRYDVFRADFFEVITSLMSRYGIPVDLLRLEITESAFAESTELIVSVVKSLINFGFTLEIDDFGSGYSSLNTLKSVPAQVVKLDMRFLEGDDDSERSGNIIESIVRMTKWLGMSVIAEGVETREQADFLKSIGCSYVQGYLYARPMPEADFRELLCGSGREEKLLKMETVQNLDNNSFWDPNSMDTLIFNSYVGGACIFEYQNDQIELLRATDKYATLIGGSNMTIEDALELDWSDYLSEESHRRLIDDLQTSISDKTEVTGEYVFVGLPDCPNETHLRSTLRVIASAGGRYLVYCTNENITAQRLAEKKERESAEQLKAVMDNVACGITAVVVSGEHIDYLMTNDLYYELLGYTREQYRDEVGSRAFSTILPDDVEKVRQTVETVMRTNAPQTIEFRALRRDKSVIWLRSHISMSRFEGVENSVQLSTYTDVTAEKLAEQELRDTSRQLNSLMVDTPGGFCRVRIRHDRTTELIYANDSYCALVGMSREEVFNTYSPISGFPIHPEDRPSLDASSADPFLFREGFSSKLRLQGAEGYIWVNLNGRFVRDEAGDTYANLFFADISEAVRAEALQAELLDNLPCGAALYEFDGKVLSAVHINRRYWELVERAPKEYVGLSVLSAVHPDDAKIIALEIKTAAAEQRDAVCDLRIRCGEAGYRAFRVTGRIVIGAAGRYSVYASYTPIVHNVTSIQAMLPIALSAMMDAREDYSFVKDISCRYVCCSRAVAKLAKQESEADMVGRSDHELFEKSLADAFYADDRYVIDSGASLIDLIDRLPSDDGTDRYACTSKFPLKDDCGNIIGVYGVGRDITADRTMKTQFELLTNSIPGGIATYEYIDGKIRMTYFSDGFCRLFGVTREDYEQLSRIDPFSGVFPEDLPRLTESVNELIHNNIPADCVYRVKLREGFKWINMKAVRADEADRVVFNSVLVDVTVREEAIEKLRISEEENRLAMQHSGNLVCRFDVPQRTLRIPEADAARFGLPPMITDLPDSSIRRGTISPETEASYTSFYNDIISGSESAAAVFQKKGALGWRWLEAHASTIFEHGKRPISAVISFTDITERLEKETAYKKWQQSLENKPPESYSLFRCNVNKNTVFDAVEGSLLHIGSPSGHFNFDKLTDEYVDSCVLADDAETFADFLNADRLLASYYSGSRILSLEYRERQGAGEVRWLRLSVDLIEHPHSSEVEAYLLFEDINEAKLVELATQEQAETDPLTGVLNRLTFAALVNEKITSSRNGIHALMMLDVDGFKQINDVFGHGVGDKTLVELSDTLRSAMREEDILGRLGGDEFVLFMPDIKSEYAAANCAAHLCELMRREFSMEVEISGSVGIVLAPNDGMDFDTLYKKVDAALYYVKGSGKNSYAFYSEEMADEHLPLREEAGSAAKKRRMLIVDDNLIDHALLANIFSEDFFIESAKNGSSALIRLRHYGSAVSVVLLDLMMPGMDGFAVLRKMQESAELRSIPVVVVSGDESREANLRAIRDGAVDFVNKPVDPDILRIRVASAISKAENDRLRAKNSYLEYQNSEIARYKTVLFHTKTVIIEHDYQNNRFSYDSDVGRIIAGNFDSRSLWHILLSDMTAEASTVKAMQELVLSVATHDIMEDSLLVQLKVPSSEIHQFRMNVYKILNEFGRTAKLYIALSDLGE